MTRLLILPRLREQSALTACGILYVIIQGHPKKPFTLKRQIHQGLLRGLVRRPTLWPHKPA